MLPGSSSPSSPAHHRCAAQLRGRPLQTWSPLALPPAASVGQCATSGATLPCHIRLGWKWRHGVAVCQVEPHPQPIQLYSVVQHSPSPAVSSPSSHRIHHFLYLAPGKPLPRPPFAAVCLFQVGISRSGRRAPPVPFPELHHTAISRSRSRLMHLPRSSKQMQLYALR
jgi:hypothetical protein